MAIKYLDKNGLEHIGYLVQDAKTRYNTINITGSNIELENTTENSSIKVNNLNGNTEQETTTGKNLLNLSNITTTTINGVTFTPVFENNMLQYINVNGTATARAFYSLGITTLADGNYRTTGCPRGGSNSTYAIYNTGNHQNDTGNGQVFKNGSGLQIFIENGYTANNLKFKPMISSDTSLTYDDYEPYIVGKPSPDIPSEIETVTGRQEISVTGKNMLNDTTWQQNKVVNGTSGAITYSQNNAASEDYILVKPNTTYTFSTSLQCRGLRIGKYKKDKTFIERIDGTDVSSYTFTTDSNTYFVRWNVNYNDATITQEVINSLNLQLEKGSTVTEYEEFKGQSYEINLGKNLFDGKLELGSYYNEDGTKINSNNTYRNKNFIKVQPNTTYTFSINGISQKYCLYFYNKSKSYLNNNLDLTTGTFTTPENCYYVNFRCYQADFTNDYANLKVQLEKGSQTTIYSAYKTPIELCKIGDYKDYIYNNNGKWYKHKAIGKIVLNGSESGWTSTGTNVFRSATNIINVSQQSNARLGLCDYYKFNPVINSVTGTLKDGEFAIQIGTDNTGTLFFKNSNITTVSDWQTYLSNNNVIVYYVLATPVEEEITDSELISQLEELEKMYTLNKKTYINVESTYLPIILNINYDKAHFLNVNDKIDLQSMIANSKLYWD